MAVQNCTVLSTLSPEQPQRIVPYVGGCEVEGETLAHNLCECEALASLRHVFLGPFFLDPKDIKSLNMGAIWNCSKGTGLP